MRAALLACLAALLFAACAPAPGPVSGERRAPGPLPAAPEFETAVPWGATAYDNRALADLFVHLALGLEWGAQRPNLVRLEQPIRVGMTGAGAGPYTAFLDRFLARLRAGTGIEIARQTGPHNLRIHLVPGADFRARVPRHLCVVAPGGLGWEEFRTSPEQNGTRAFEQVRSVRTMSVYIPDTLAPYLIRRCLIEEVTQALGLANDLDGLGDTIFNDDGTHIWPTALDHLMLRVLHAPEVQAGAGRAQARAGALAALSRLHPQGNGGAALPPLRIRAMRDWAGHLQAAFLPGRTQPERIASAETALSLAAARVPGSVHHCRSLIALARLLRDDAGRQLAVLDRAGPICSRAHGSADPRLDLIALSRATALYRLGRASAAWGVAEPLGPRLAALGQGERLVALYALHAAALAAIQQPGAADLARQRAAAWAGYALGRNHPRALRLAKR